MLHARWSLVLMLIISASAVSADFDIPVEKNIPLALANEAAATAVKFCHDKGWTVTATVVDRAGQVKAVQRADGAGPHTIDASRSKAYTAASARNATSAMQETSQKNPAAANLGDIDGFLLLAGGVPIRIGDEVIGAIGVGGAPGGPLDEQCAEAGIKKIQELLKE